MNRFTKIGVRKKKLSPGPASQIIHVNRKRSWESKIATLIKEYGRNFNRAAIQQSLSTQPFIDPK